MFSLHPSWPKSVPRSDPNPIQADPNLIQSDLNPIQADPIRSNPVRPDPNPDPDRSMATPGRIRMVTPGRKSPEIIRTHRKSSERKPSGLSIGQSKCVVLLDNPSVALIHYTSTSKSVQTGSCRVQTGYICPSKSTNKQVGCIPKSAQHGSEAPASRTRHGRTQPSGAKSGSDPSRVRPVFKTN